MATNLKEKRPFPAVFDNTMRCAFVNCPRSFFLSYIHDLKPQGENVNLHAGAAFAKGIETTRMMHYARGEPVAKATAEGARELLKHYGDFVAPDKSAKTSDRTLGALGSYLAQYPPETDHIQPLVFNGKPAIEFSFAHPLTDVLHPTTGEPIIYCGRFDMLGVLNNNPSSVFVVDEKTTSQLGATWSKQWELRSQFMGYVWACQQSGIDLDTVCVRGIGILKTKFSEAEAFKTFTSLKIERWHDQLRRDLWRLRRAWDEGYFDYNFADACSSYGGCPFIDLCSSPAPERWFSHFTQRRWNPVLKNPIEVEKS